MTKKEQMALHSCKCKIEAVDVATNKHECNIRYVVSMSLTAGELLALRQGLMDASTPVSPVAKDVLAFLNNALYRADIEL